MANQNFVVHNGLTVGPTTIDAASGNITMPITKGLYIGNVLLRDNGDGRLAVRDRTDNNDAVIVATIDAPSVTQGNIQIGTNHIESVNPDGPISLRPNGNGNIAFSSNTIMIGHGGAYTLVGTGIQTDPAYGINYPASNIIVTMSALNASANLRLSMTTAATSVSTGALQVSGGVGVVGTVVAGHLNATGNVVATTAEVATVEATGMIRANSTAAATSTTTGALVTAGGLGVAGAAYVGGNLVVAGNLFVSGNTTVISANNLIINDSMIYLADDNPADILDIGFVSSFTNPTYQHTGLVRDATDGIWKLFANVAAEPTTTVDFTNARYSDLRVGNITPGVSNLASLGSSTLWWNTIWGEAVNAQYADLAEKYLADAVYEPGTVLMFGGAQEVTECVDDMSTRVAGVVSTNPAYLMNHKISGDTVIDLALTGRVPTKVTGTVKKGDMMVSAGAGRARAEANPRVGSVIGKALENSEGDAVIEVVVGKH